MAASSPVPHPEYLITLIAPGSGAGDGVPGAAVREAASGRIVDLVPGRNDVYSAVTGTGDNRLFYLAARSSHAETAEREPEIGRLPPGGAVRVRIDEAGTVAEFSAVPGVPEPDPMSHGPNSLAATADGGILAYPIVPPRDGRGTRPPAGIALVTVATGERTEWRPAAGGFPEGVSLSADGRRMAFSWPGRREDTGIHVVDLPATLPGGVITTPSRLVVPDRNTLSESPMGQSGLGCLGDAAISADGSVLYVAAARGEGGGQATTRLAEVEVADGRLMRIAFERAFRDPGNIIYGWGPMVIDPSGQHVLIAYTGHLARIDLSTGQLTELPITEHGAHSIAW